MKTVDRFGAHSCIGKRKSFFFKADMKCFCYLAEKTVGRVCFHFSGNSQSISRQTTTGKS